MAFIKPIYLLLFIFNYTLSLKRYFEIRVKISIIYVDELRWFWVAITHMV